MSPAGFVAWESALSPVDRWKLGQLNPKQRATLEGRPAEEWPVFLFAMAPMIGDDLARDPETRLLLVRLAVANQDRNMLQTLSWDSSPMVRRAADRAADEMEGDRPAQSHHAALVESIRWERARKRAVDGAHATA